MPNIRLQPDAADASLLSRGVSREQNMRLLKPGVCTILSLIFVGYSSSVLALPPVDDYNAAMLYYQAFLSFPEEYKEMTLSLPLEPLPSGIIEPNKDIRLYLMSCRHVFKFTKAAANLAECDWGRQYLRGDEAFGPQYPASYMPYYSHIRPLGLHLMTQAQVNAVDGKYREALENCLIIHKIARHCGGEDTDTVLLSAGSHGLANKAIMQVLGMMPSNLTLLVWLENELTQLSQRPCVEKVLLAEEKAILDSMNHDNHGLVDFAKMCRGDMSDDAIEQRVRLAFRNWSTLWTKDVTSTIEAVRKYNFKSIQDFIEGSRIYQSQTITALQSILEEAIPFKTQVDRLQRLEKKVRADVTKYPHALFTCSWSHATSSRGLFTFDTHLQSDDNMLKVAIHLLKTVSKTGDLPDTLPTGLPKNVYIDKDFYYQKTEDGFILRMEMIGRPKDMTECAFRVPQES